MLQEGHTLSNLERVYWLDGQIRDKQYPNAQALMDKFSIKIRAARDDIAYLRYRLEAPLWHNPRYKGLEYTDPHFVLPFLALGLAEADTLRRTLTAARTHLPPADKRLVEALAAKLSPYIRGIPTRGGAVTSAAEVFTGTVTLAREYLPSDALVGELRRAIEQRRRVFLEYYSAHNDETTHRTVRPYSLLNWRGEIYLISFCELRQAFRDFFLSRIQTYNILDNEPAFLREGTFDLDAYVNEAFVLQRGKQPVLVRAKFTRYQARWIRERVYHPSQQTASQPDGSLLLTLTVPVTDELTRWLLSFGGDVEVLEPMALRETLRETFARCAQLYPNGESS